jgi:hypothetical protein
MKSREDIGIYIIATNFVLAVLLFASLFVFAYQINKTNYSGAISSLQAIIPIAAAWLVLCIADRQLLIDSREKEHQRKLEAVKSLHYLIVIGSDLRAQAGHFGFMLTKSEYHVLPHQLEALASGIEKRYEEMLQEKDAYRFLHGVVLNKLLGLSGSIFGLTSLLRSIAVQANLTGKPVREVFESLDNVGLLKTIASNDLEINTIVDDLREARAAIG